MKLLSDQNISYRITKLLGSIYPECKHVSDFGLEDTDDNDIWQFAKLNSYVIVTFDSDFYEISLINGHPPKIIWLRTGNSTTKIIKDLLFFSKKKLPNL
jgi:predicted nuclease of predicted toxin-antitoxin system